MDKACKSRDPARDSGKRVSNAYETCPEVGDTLEKSKLIPHVPATSHEVVGKDGATERLLSLLEGPASHQLVGRVTAYQGI